MVRSRHIIPVVLAVFCSCSKKAVVRPRPYTPREKRLKNELASTLSGATQRVAVLPGGSRAPDANDQLRFPHFRRANEQRWKLELDVAKVPPGTVYELTGTGAEGERVAQYLVFDGQRATWWYTTAPRKEVLTDEPYIRKAKVIGLSLAAFDGKSGYTSVDRSDDMPLDRGLRIRIEAEGGFTPVW